MLELIIRRTLNVIPICLVVFTIVFCLMRIAPGDPATAMLGDYASAEAVQSLRQEMGLDRPLWSQYLDSLRGLLHGDLGRSLSSGAPVSDQIASALPETLALAASSLAIGLLLGVPLGIVTAVRRGRPVDHAGRLFSLSGLSIPSFVLGILLMLLFAIDVPIFPAIGGGRSGDLSDQLLHLALPSLTLGLIMMAYVTRVMRTSMLNVLQEDYIRTARSKGIGELRVVLRHALPNCLVPLVSLCAINVIVLISSSVMVEIIFSRPGLGRLLISAMRQRDYVSLQSVLVVYAGIVILVNMTADLLYGVVNPRIRSR
ncbi:peptide/nickel transport system permease protein/glutathione transport system permease protein [Tistlia consotensis]|uniref:Peptide/nickel transport system permease protein/glutathione transport system permease protein n=1 Tax=Tistlia consotensis USBA 355 TaxID=560819 RepID=A0A1Y6C189_9PROT|nr:ABC transporter permease [Tistlia consotensis]SMF36540.1 peptide/nickel transport system permease protein/glutathione transport system permease protein [Tistlia consotensis USBA 355]SNR72081.1 peptide/nickel transport system permease protein/glutathione transport system permease protein [Tistlia consotensis]